ncbi:hypothetical protein POP72_020 [Pectobacterium phage POP72]|uniref:Uncharacterized protein n=2 Tax=Axomammavirus PP1 TaxID=2733578 RepID=I7F4X8_9CAUD|nr:nucleotidyltransferase [Pectobacterium phage PP1]AFP33681.1 hypothetical protein PP1_018 [Pectobacterium phage PP1]ARB10936.1 hypothetical protein POP72_020 [Pectobacterium phage POP72]
MSRNLLKKMHCMVEAMTGETFYIAGGAVVDFMYGVVPKDYDMVLCKPDWNEAEAFEYLKDLSDTFAMLGCSTKIYQSYGLNLGEEVNPTSFQSMFLGCMKVTMSNCHLDILISRAPAMTEHVLKHDCNMNMVWYNGQRICWEHGGNEPKVKSLIFADGVVESRKERMYAKFGKLTSLSCA